MTCKGQAGVVVCVEVGGGLFFLGVVAPRTSYAHDAAVDGECEGWMCGWMGVLAWVGDGGRADICKLTKSWLERKLGSRHGGHCVSAQPSAALHAVHRLG